MSETEKSLIISKDGSVTKFSIYYRDDKNTEIEYNQDTIGESEYYMIRYFSAFISIDFMQMGQIAWTKDIPFGNISAVYIKYRNKEQEKEIAKN